jgi:hypothetical protein
VALAFGNCRSRRNKLFLLYIFERPTIMTPPIGLGLTADPFPVMNARCASPAHGTPDKAAEPPSSDLRNHDN